MIEPTLFSLKARIIHSNLDSDIAASFDEDSRTLQSHGFYSLDKPAYTLIASDISAIGIIGEAVLTTQADVLAAVSQRLRDGKWAFTSKHAPVMGVVDESTVTLLVLMRPSLKDSSAPVFDLLAVGDAPHAHAREYRVSVCREGYIYPIMVSSDLMGAARFYTKSLISYGSDRVSLERLVPVTYHRDNPVMGHAIVPISSYQR